MVIMVVESLYNYEICTRFSQIVQQFQKYLLNNNCHWSIRYLSRIYSSLFSLSSCSQTTTFARMSNIVLSFASKSARVPFRRGVAAFFLLFFAASCKKLSKLACKFATCYSKFESLSSTFDCCCNNISSSLNRIRFPVVVVVVDDGITTFVGKNNKSFAAAAAAFVEFSITFKMIAAVVALMYPKVTC